MIVVSTMPARIEQLVEAHRSTWLRDAEASIMALDPQDYRQGRTFHVLDFTEVGAPPRGYLGFAAHDQLHELALHLLPHGTGNVPAAAVAVNVEAIALAAVASADADAGDQLGMIRAAVAAVAAHELAHVLEARVSGRRFADGATLDDVVRSLADGTAEEPEHQTQAHSAGWLRAFLHLILRSAGSPHHREWIARLAADLAAVMPYPASTYFDALKPDFIQHRRDALLVDVLRSPAPKAFVDLFDSHDAAKPARGDLLHARPS